MYARVRECEYEKPIFDCNGDDPDNLDSPEIIVRQNFANDETSFTPGTTPECSPDFFPKTDGLCDQTDTNHYSEPDAEANSEQPHPTIANPGCTKNIHAVTGSRITMTMTNIDTFVTPKNSPGYS